MADFAHCGISSICIQDLTDGDKTVVVHRQPSRAITVLENLREMRQNAEFTDVVLCAGGVDFPCHKAVLAASSPYFRAMFTSDLRERNSQRIQLPEIYSNTLALILDYVYSGEVKITLENVQSLFQAADFLDYNNLSAGCIVFLKNNITVDNCIDLIQFACRCSSSGSLLDAAMTLLDNNFENVSKNRAFLEIEPDILIRVLTSESIRLTNEETIVFACLRWLAHDFERREKHSGDIINCIRLPLVKETVLKHLRASSSLVRESSSLYDAFNEAICCQILIQSGKRVLGAQTYPRHIRPGQRSEVMMIMGGQYLSDDGEIICSNEVWCTFLPSMNGIVKPSWTPLSPLPDYLKRKYCVTAVGNSVYVTGGFDVINNRSIRAVWCYSYNRNIWYSIADLLHARHSHGALEFSGKLAVIGGKSSLSDNRLNYFEIYDPAENAWREMERMPIAVSVPSVVQIDGRIYVIGGATEDGSACQKIQVFNLSLELWTLIDMSSIIRRKTLRAVPLGKRIFMVGSRKPRDALTYNFRTGREASNRQPLDSRLFPGMTSHHDKIWLVGGKSDDRILETAEVYDPSIDRWNTIVDFLPRGLYLHGCVTITEFP